MDDARTKALAVLAVGILAISWSAVLVRLCEAPAMVIALYRLGLSVLALAPWYLWAQRGVKEALSAHALGWILVSGLCLALHFLAWIEAVQRAPVAMAVTLSSTHPIMVGLLSRLLLGEAFGGGKVLGAALAVAGTAGMAWVGQAAGSGDLTGYLWALGAAFFFSLYMMVGRRLRASMGLMAYVLPTYGVAALWMFAAVAWKGLPMLGYPARTFLMFLLLALVPTTIGHSSLNWALGHLSASLVAVSVLGEPIGASVLAWVILGERVGPWRILFGMVILIGIYAAARTEAALGIDSKGSRCDGVSLSDRWKRDGS